MKIQYEGMSDEQLIRKIREGETAVTDYVMNKYKNLVERNAKTMYLIGGEEKDLIQEGMLGLFKAILDFDETQESSFYRFAKLCISRQLYTAIKTSQRQKHMPLNSYVSIYGDDEDEYEEKKPHPLIEVLSEKKERNPETLFVEKEYFSDVECAIKKRLSDLEQQVFQLYLQGEDYRSIAKRLNKKPKTIDNALQRIKQKMRTILE